MSSSSSTSLPVRSISGDVGDLLLFAAHAMNSEVRVESVTMTVSPRAGSAESSSSSQPKRGKKRDRDEDISAQFKQAQAELKSLRKEVAELTAAKVGLESRYEKLETLSGGKDSRINELRRDLREKTAELTTLQTSAASSNGAENTRLNNEILDLRNKLNSAVRRAEKYEKERDLVLRQAPQNHIAPCQRCSTLTAAEKMALEGRVTVREREFDALTQIHQGSRAQITALQRENEGMQQQVRHADTRIGSLLDASQRLEQENGHLHQYTESLHSKFTSYRQATADILTNSNQKISELTSQLTAANQRIDRRDATIHALQSRVQRAEKANEAAHSTLCREASRWANRPMNSLNDIVAKFLGVEASSEVAHAILSDAISNPAPVSNAPASQQSSFHSAPVSSSGGFQGSQSPVHVGQSAQPLRNLNFSMQFSGSTGNNPAPASNAPASQQSSFPSASVSSGGGFQDFQPPVHGAYSAPPLRTQNSAPQSSGSNPPTLHLYSTSLDFRRILENMMGRFVPHQPG